MNKLYRTPYNRVLGGVCGGLAEYSNTDPTIIRLLVVILSLFGLGITFLLYIIAWIIIPEKY